jgi:hypothetical protein
VLSGLSGFERCLSEEIEGKRSNNLSGAVGKALGYGSNEHEFNRWQSFNSSFYSKSELRIKIDCDGKAIFDDNFPVVSVYEEHRLNGFWEQFKQLMVKTSES